MWRWQCPKDGWPDCGPVHSPATRAEELLFLASHGLMHLLGWDHPDEDSLATMLARQTALLLASPS
jgi:rRNA maturation RNase YbeY